MSLVSWASRQTDLTWPISYPALWFSCELGVELKGGRSLPWLPASSFVRQLKSRERYERLMDGSCIEAEGLETTAGNLRRGHRDGQIDYTMGRRSSRRVVLSCWVVHVCATLQAVTGTDTLRHWTSFLYLRCNDWWNTLVKWTWWRSPLPLTHTPTPTLLC